MGSYRTIRSVERALAVLSALNKTSILRPHELEAKLGLPSATVIRILETLEDLGYVRNNGRRAGYTLTEKVLELSAGYHGLPVFVQEAERVLLELTAAIRWPAALATLDDVSMVVRLSTIPQSPLAHTHSTLQKRLELLTRAHGRAYLAYCREEERARLYRRLCEARVTTLSPDALEARMVPILDQVRRLGFAQRDHEIDPQTTTLAMPVLAEDSVLATVGVTCFRGAQADRNRILTELRKTVRTLQDIAGNAESNFTL